MNTLRCAAVGLALALLAGGVVLAVHGEDDRHDRDGEHHESGEHGREEGRGRAAAMDPAYREACGACHFAYPAGLLPAGSWRLLLAGLGDHFGNPVDLDPAVRSGVASYLEAGAADRSGAEASEELLRGLGRDLPLRITDLPGFRREHRKLAADVATRPAIGSLANCPACHRTAEAGDFDDDNVSIPQQ
ncbi:MAG: diheme cytochrome c [Thermodesulfobacteriota bacterium]